MTSSRNFPTDYKLIPDLGGEKAYMDQQEAGAKLKLLGMTNADEDADAGLGGSPLSFVTGVGALAESSLDRVPLPSWLGGGFIGSLFGPAVAPGGGGVTVPSVKAEVNVASMSHGTTPEEVRVATERGVTDGLTRVLRGAQRDIAAREQ